MRWLPLLALASCATAPVERLSFDEAMGWNERQPLPALTRSTPTGTGSPMLQGALIDLEDAGLAYRRLATKGQAMEAPHRAAWERALHLLEPSLTTATAFDCTRARLVLERELEADARTYGDLPLPLVEAIQGALKTLSGRLARWHRAAQPQSPKQFLWPLPVVEVTSSFGGRPHPISGDWRQHSGVDLLCERAEPVRSASGGTVVYAGWNGGHGKQVVVQHDGHLATHYSHLEAVLVDAGQKVSKGDVLGLAGDSGRATGVHLHFELRVDGEAVDPQAEIPPPPLRPWPMAPAMAEKRTGPESPPGPSGTTLGRRPRGSP